MAWTLAYDSVGCAERSARIPISQPDGMDRFHCFDFDAHHCVADAIDVSQDADSIRTAERCTLSQLVVDDPSGCTCAS